MSANLMIDNKTGETAFVNNVKNINDRAWHLTGKEVNHAMTYEEAIKESHLDYNVATRRLKVSYKKKDIFVPGKMATINEGNGEILGEVSSTYHVVQNIDAFGFFTDIVGKKEAIFETAGALGKGEKIFVSAKLPSYIKVGGKDVIEKYLFLTNSHDGWGALQAAFTPIRIVCNNTLNAALANCSNRVVIRHTKNAKDAIDNAKNIMKIVDTRTKDLEQAYQQMAKVKITDEELLDFIKKVMVKPLPQKEQISNEEYVAQYSKRSLNLVDSIFEYSQSNESQLLETTKGTAFGAYNAITGYFQNLKDWKSPDEKLDALIITDRSDAFKKTQKAFDLAIAMS